MAQALSISKTVPSAGPYYTGEGVVYTITVTNTSTTTNATNVVLSDNVPANFASVVWSCTSSSTTSTAAATYCNSFSSTAINLSSTVSTLLPGESVVYKAIASVAIVAAPVNGVNNTARVSAAGTAWTCTTPLVAGNCQSTVPVNLTNVRPTPFATCTSDPAMFNTGILRTGPGTYGPNSGIKPNNSSVADGYWQVWRGIPGASATQILATEPTYADFSGLTAVYSDAMIYKAAPSWASSPYSNAEWLGVSNAAQNVTYLVYRYQFKLQYGVDPSSFNLKFDAFADDGVVKAYANGAPMQYYQPTPGAGFLPANGGRYVLTGTWKPNNDPTGTVTDASNTNSIYFVVRNSLQQGGLLVQATGTPSCAPAVHVEKHVTNLTASGGGATAFATSNGVISYEVQVVNSSAADMSNVLVQDDVAAVGLSAANLGTWSCSVPIGSTGTCPTTLTTTNNKLNATIATLPSGGIMIFTLTSARFPVTLTQSIYTNTATISGPSVDCSAKPNFPTPCSDSVSVTASPLVNIVKTVDSPGPLYPGQLATYTITVNNPAARPLATGTASSAAALAAATLTNVTVSDVLPPGFSSATWTCSVPTGSEATCPATSSGNLAAGGTLSAVIPQMKGQSSVVFTVVATVDNVTAVSTPRNTANITAATAPSAVKCFINNTTATTNLPCSSFADTTLSPKPKLAIQKTVPSAGPYFSGQTVAYSVAVKNAGVVAATQVSLTDALPSDFASVNWSCAPTTNAFCSTFASSSLSLNTTIPTLAVGETITFTAQAVLGAVGTIKTNVPNTATVAPSTLASSLWTCVDFVSGASLTQPCQSTALINLSPTPQLSIQKLNTSGSGPFYPGQSVNYTITVANPSTVPLSNVVVNDALPSPQFTASSTWACAVASGTATCPGFTTPSQTLTTTAFTLPAQSSLTFTATAMVGAVSGIESGVINVAAAQPTGSTPWTCVSPGTLVNGACQSSAPVNLSDTPQLAVLKQVPAGAGPYYTNGQVTYTIRVSNPSTTVPITQVQVTDTLPSDFSSVAWSCVPGAGSTCPSFSASGLTLNTTIASLNPGGSVTFTAVGTLGNVAAAQTGVANTATVNSTNTAVPWICTTGTNAACQSTALINLAVTPQLAVQKLVPAGSGPYFSNQAVTYTIKVSNPAAVGTGVAITQVQVDDTLPSDFVSAAWSCQASSTNTTCPTFSPTGLTLTATGLTLAPGEFVTFTAIAQLGTVSANQTGLSNTATVKSNATTPWACTTGTNAACQSAALVNLAATPQLAVDKQVTSGSGPYFTGAQVTYTVKVSNPGTATAVTNVKVDDALPSDFVSAAWTCAASSTNTTCPTFSPTGLTLAATGLTLAPGEYVTFTAVATLGTVSANAAGISNTAIVKSDVTTPWVCVPASTTGDCRSTVLINLSATPQLAVEKRVPAGSGPYFSNQAVTYTIKVSNPATVGTAGTISQVQVDDTLPSNFLSAAWTCQASSTNTTCPTISPTGLTLAATGLSLAPGEYVTFTAVAQLGAVNANQSGVVNTATVKSNAATPWACTTGTNAACQSVASVNLAATPQLAVDKQVTTGSGPYYSGAQVTYTVKVSNPGTVTSVTNVQVDDALPANFVSAAWTCAASSTNTTCPTFSPTGLTLAATGLTLAPGEYVTFTAVAQLGAVNTNQTGVANTAIVKSDVTTPWVCVPASTTGDCRSTALINLIATPQLAVEKLVTSGAGPYLSGGQVTYTIKVSNPGTATSVTNVKVDDTLPSSFVSASWTCAASSTNTTCPTISPTGLVLAATGLTLAPGEYVTFTVQATLGSISGIQSGILNTAIVKSDVTTPWVCMPASTTGDCRSTAVINLSDMPKVSIDKRATTGVGPYYSGQQVTYTITVKNAGTVAVSQMVVSDTLPSAFASATWSCAAGSGTAVCPAFEPAALTLAATGVDLAAGDSLVFTAVATLGSVTTNQTNVPNTATVASLSKATTIWSCVNPVNGAVLPSPCQSTALINLAVDPQLSIVKSVTSTLTTYYTGDTVSYAIKVSNPGNIALPNVDVSDALVTGLEPGTWSCVPGATTPCPVGMPTGAAQALSVTLPSLAVGETVTFNVTTKVSANPPVTIPNTASAKSSDVLTKCVGSTSTAMPCLSTVSISSSTSPQLSLKKTVTPDSNVGIASELTYTITVSNTGAVDLPNVVINDTQPDNVKFESWTCTGTGVTCPALGPVGTQLTQTVPTLPKGATLVYTITAHITAAAPVNATFTNTATATSSLAATQCVGTTHAVPCDASASATTLGLPTDGLAVPVDKPWMLALMSLALIGMAGVAQRRRVRRFAQGKR